MNLRLKALMSTRLLPTHRLFLTQLGTQWIKATAGRHTKRTIVRDTQVTAVLPEYAVIYDPINTTISIQQKLAFVFVI